MNGEDQKSISAMSGGFSRAPRSNDFSMTNLTNEVAASAWHAFNENNLSCAERA